MQDFIGLRVARWRDVAGMTQQQLADAVGVTAAYISMIECGKRAVTKRSLLIGLASTLGVSITDLTSQPLPRSRDELVVYGIGPAVRVALDDEPGDEIEQHDLADVRCDVDRAMAARMACDYPVLAGLLPHLITQTRMLAESGGADARTGRALFVRVATTAASTVKSVGYADLAMRLAEQSLAAARELESDAETAASAFAVAQAALTGGSRRRSLAVSSTAADALADNATALDDNDSRAWYGMLRLHAGLSAASLGRYDDAEAHLAEAEGVVDQVVGDPWRQEFSAANVGIWRVSIAVENGAPERAPELARRVDRTQVRTRQRLARLHMDAGRGLYMAGQTERALARFLEADTVAPQDVRTRPAVREIVGQMARDSRRQGGSDRLRELLTRMGINPFEPDDAHLA